MINLPWQVAKADNIDIKSRSLEIDRATDSATFKGVVIVKFQDMVIKTNKLKVFYDTKSNKRSIKKLVIETAFKALYKNEVINGRSAEYLVENQQLTLYDSYIGTDQLITKSHKLVYTKNLPRVKINSKNKQIILDKKDFD